MTNSKGKVYSSRLKLIEFGKFLAKLGVIFSAFYFLTCVTGLIFSIIIFALLCIFLFFIYIFVYFIFYRNKKIKYIYSFYKISIFMFTIWALIFGLTFAISFYDPMKGVKVAQGITKEKIMSLKIGIDKSSVISILGEPIRTNSNYKNLLSYFFGYFIGHESIENGYFIYATSIILHGDDGFVFNIRIKNNKMVNAYIKKNDFLVYSCGKTQCPYIVKKDEFEEFLQLSSRISNKN